MKGSIKWCAMWVPDACLITLSLHIWNFPDVNTQCVHLFNFSLSPQIPNWVEYMKRLKAKAVTICLYNPKSSILFPKWDLHEWQSFAMALNKAALSAALQGIWRLLLRLKVWQFYHKETMPAGFHCAFLNYIWSQIPSKETPVCSPRNTHCGGTWA